MKRLLVFLTLAAFAVMPRAAAQGAQPVSACSAPLPHASVLVGMTDTAAYFPKLKGLRVAVLANHTAVARFCEPAQGKYAAEAERLREYPQAKRRLCRTGPGVGRLVCRGLPPTGRSIWSICCTAADSM